MWISWPIESAVSVAKLHLRHDQVVRGGKQQKVTAGMYRRMEKHGWQENVTGPASTYKQGNLRVGWSTPASVQVSFTEYVAGITDSELHWSDFVKSKAVSL